MSPDFWCKVTTDFDIIQIVSAKRVVIIATECAYCDKAGVYLPYLSHPPEILPDFVDINLGNYIELDPRVRNEYSGETFGGFGYYPYLCRQILRCPSLSPTLRTAVSRQPSRQRPPSQWQRATRYAFLAGMQTWLSSWNGIPSKWTVTESTE